jgi:DNA repair ATPase RecN
MDSDELKILAATIGAFKTVMLLDKILENKDEVLFFKKMYKQYVERIENIYIKLNDILASINKILTDFDPKQLEGFSEDLKKAIDNLNIK